MAKKKIEQKIETPEQQAANLSALEQFKAMLKTPVPSPVPQAPMQQQPSLADRQAAGNAYIQQREQIAARQGITPNMAAKQINAPLPMGQSITPQEVNANIAQQNAILSSIGQLTPEQQAQTQADIGGVGNSLQGILPEVAANTVQNVATGIVGGAIAGSAGGPVGIGLGALGGGIVSAFNIVSKLKEEEKQKTANVYKDFTTSRTALKAIITFARNGGDPVEATRLYNNEIARIYRAESNLKQLEEREWLSKAKGELTAIETFRRNQLTYDSLMAAAIMKNPDANFEFPPEEIITQ